MEKILMLLLLVSCCGCQHSNKTSLPAHQQNHAIAKLEMHLSAFGVESDNFPSVDADIDFTKKQAICRRWYYNPAHKDSTYLLTAKTIDTIYQLLVQTDFTKLKRLYERPATDQPSSTLLIIQSNKDTVTIKDYGLIGDYPLRDIYRLVYQLHLLR